MNNLREIAQKFKTEGDFEVYENEKMTSRFSFKIGGITPLLVEPLTESAFLSAINMLKAEKIPYFILGGGTNVVFSDDGFDGAVLSTVKLNKIEEISLKDGGEPEEVILKCQCGVLMNTLVNYCTKHSYSGLEQFSGLPGTCGGACYMNARCFDLEVSDVAGDIEYIAAGNDSACIKTLKNDKSKWNYKISPFTGKEDIILSVQFKVKKGTASQDEILAKAAGFMKQRVEKGHFKFPCAGSVFKNNRDFGAPTGQIIDSEGLKGYSIGGAQIAPWHGNIIINTGNATQKDVKTLVDYVKKQVKDKKGFDLEEEIIFV